MWLFYSQCVCLHGLFKVIVYENIILVFKGKSILDEYFLCFSLSHWFFFSGKCNSIQFKYQANFVVKVLLFYEHPTYSVFLVF